MSLNEYSLFFESCVKMEILMDVMMLMYNVENGFKDFLLVG